MLQIRRQIRNQHIKISLKIKFYQNRSINKKVIEILKNQLKILKSAILWRHQVLLYWNKMADLNLTSWLILICWLRIWYLIFFIKGLGCDKGELLILLSRCGNPKEEHACMSKERHRNHLNTCLKHLNKFLDRSDDGSCSDLVLLAEDLRMAVRQIGKITGEVTTDHLLDVIFKEFCIGK